MDATIIFDIIGSYALAFGIVFGIISVVFAIIFAGYGIPPPPGLVIVPGYDTVYKQAYEYLTSMGYIPYQLAQHIWSAVTANVLFNLSIQFAAFCATLARLFGAPPVLVSAAFLFGLFVDYCKLRYTLRKYFGLSLPP